MRSITLLVIISTFGISHCNEATSKFINFIETMTMNNKLSIPELLRIAGEHKLSDLLTYYTKNIEHLHIDEVIKFQRVLEEIIDFLNPDAIALKRENEYNPPLLKIEDGMIRGKIVKSKGGVKYYSFTGIPYARKPKRWQAPEDVIPWKGILNATDNNVWCWQPFIPIDGLSGGTEDCLLLNVYIKSLTKKNIPVIVHVHGGRYKVGNGGLLSINPSLLVEQDVIVVIFNYRLGVFGFLSSGTKDAPGNAGLKDVVMALKWIQKNIHHFGGDPNNVTVYGYSTGSAMVELLLMSPLAQGLFNKVVMQSGSALGDSSFNKDPETAVFQLAGILDIKSNTIDGIMKELKNIHPRSLINAADRIIFNPFNLDLVFKPCIEKVIDGEIPFLTEYPENLLKTGQFYKVPVMQSFVQNEGNFYLLNKEFDESYFSSPEYIVSRDILVRMNSRNERDDLLKKVKEFYYKDYDNATAFSKLSGDVVFVHPVHRSTLLKLKHTGAPIYHALFAFDSEVGTTKKLYDYVPPGVAHSDDLSYY